MKEIISIARLENDSHPCHGRIVSYRLQIDEVLMDAYQQSDGVSSNGKDYFRFPSISTATQTDLAGSNYKNLAGVYDYNYGVGFDLDEITDNEKLDKSNIRFVRIVDVLTGVSKDSQGNVI